MTLDPVTVVETRAEVGTKEEVPLVETPQSVSVVRRAQIDALRPRTIDEALRYTPGVTGETRGSAATRQDFQYFRGFGPFGNAYLDGLKLPFGTFGIYQVDPFMVDRIEVLKGPSSVLYGQNSPGGLLNTVSKKPLDAPYHEVTLQGGNHGRFEGDLDFSGPLDEAGKWSYRLTGVARTGGTQIDHTKEQRVAVSPALTWKPDADTTLTILGSYLHDPDSGHFGFLPAAGTLLPNANGRIRRSFFDGDPSFDHDSKTQYAVGYTFDHRFGEHWSVRQRLRYTRLDSDLKFVAGNGLLPDDRTLTRLALLDKESARSLAVDTAATAEFETGALRHSVLFGIDYRHATSDVDLRFGIAPGLDVFNPSYGQPIPTPVLPLTDQKLRQNQTGLYLQDRIRLGNVALLAGLRHDWADTRTRNRATGSTVETDDHRFTARLGLTYLFDNGLAPYASWSTSFDPTLGTDFAGQPFKPTTGRQYEVGIKYEPRGFKGFFSLAAFDLVQKNALTLDPDPAHGLFQQVQSGKNRSRGIEFEAHAQPTPEWTVIASATYLDARVLRSNGPDRGKRPLSIPAYAAALWTDYTFREGPVAGLGVSVGIRYTGGTSGDTANTLHVPGYTLVDAALHYDLEPGGATRLAINVSNLFDNNAVVCVNGAGACNYIQGRTVTASITHRW